MNNLSENEMYINTPEFYDQLIETLDAIRNDISDEYLAYPDDDEPGIQVTLACNDSGNEYALQTGDNSYTGSAYGFPHWAVSAVYRDSDLDQLTDDLLSQLRDLVTLSV